MVTIKLTEEQCEALVYVATIGNLTMMDYNPEYTKGQLITAEDAIQAVIAATSDNYTLVS